MLEFAQLRRSAALMVCIALLGGCHDHSSTYSTTTVAETKLPSSVSLFGIRLGMTPDELNAAFPGAHCAPTPEHSTCEVPSAALGSTGIEVRFLDNKVFFAKTQGQINEGQLTVARHIAEDLGPAQGDQTWEATDGSELVLTGGRETVTTMLGSSEIDSPAYYELTLSSQADRTRQAEERARASRKEAADLAGKLAKYLSIDNNGRVSLCGIQVGAKFDGHLGCAPKSGASLLAGSGFYKCSNLLEDKFVFQPAVTQKRKSKKAPDFCVDVVADEVTHQVNHVSAALPVEEADEGILWVAIASLGNADKIKRTDSLMNLAGVSTDGAEFVAEYKSNAGDLLTVTGETKAIFRDGRQSKLLTISLKGQAIRNASFR